MAKEKLVTEWCSVSVCLCCVCGNVKLNVKYGYEKLVHMLKDLCPFYNVPFVVCCMARKSLHSKRGLKLKQGSVLATLDWRHAY